ncbi:prepilin-type N-terminal cleavage/methylation domain-containing protein [bacterium]|nr:prepilin-type N-terminal cleavage/methylation domain-containing protein [bacterium]
MRIRFSDTGIFQQGFTLIEILISMAIFMIGFLGIAMMLISTIRGNSFSIRLTNAVQLASQQIEEINTMDYNSVIDVDNDGISGLNDQDVSTADGYNLNAESGGIGELYNIYWNVAENSPVTNTKTIRVIVIWEEEGKNKMTILDYLRTF